jgi:hypothetical protein
VTNEPTLEQRGDHLFLIAHDAAQLQAATRLRATATGQFGRREDQANALAFDMDERELAERVLKALQQRIAVLPEGVTGWITQPPPAPVRVTCAICEFGDFSTRGECHRHAPEGDKGTGAGVWPPVRPTDWCGEGRRKPE